MDESNPGEASNLGQAPAPVTLPSTVPTTVPSGKLFSCGNHFVETTKGMLHFGEPSEMICMLGVPSTMNVRDILQFLSPCSEDLENTRIVREVNHDTCYIVLLKFRTQASAEEFYSNFNEAPYNSIESNACHLMYVTRIETFSEDPIHREQPNCAVCLERMVPEVESILTILCNHSFHTHCLGKWGDTSCPVCRYCQTPECQVENRCMECGYQQESLWMCIICGHVGCGRYIDGHAYDHFRETQHTYAMQLTDNQVWDYVGDNYVHRLLANKSDGKPVEIEGSDAYRRAEEKIEAAQLEYTYLLTQQLDSQRKYYEKQLRECEKNTQKKIKDLTVKNKKLSDDMADLEDKCQTLNKDKSNLEKKLHITSTKLAKIQSELTDERQINKSLGLNQEQFQTKLREAENEVSTKQKIIVDLEEQLRDLMFFVEARDKLKESVKDNVVSQQEVEDSQLVVNEAASTSRRNKNKTKRK